MSEQHADTAAFGGGIMSERLVALRCRFCGFDDGPTGRRVTMAEYAEWCLRCDSWPSQRCRCELHPINVYPERRVETGQDAEAEVRACPTVTPPAAHNCSPADA